MYIHRAYLFNVVKWPKPPVSVEYVLSLFYRPEAMLVKKITFRSPLEQTNPAKCHRFNPHVLPRLTLLFFYGLVPRDPNDVGYI